MAGAMIKKKMPQFIALYSSERLCSRARKRKNQKSRSTELALESSSDPAGGRGV